MTSFYFLETLKNFLASSINPYWGILELCQTSKIELFAKMIDGFQPLTIFP